MVAPAAVDRFAGTFTALATPFTKGAQALDFDAYERLLSSQLAGGVAGVVPCGTTGESPTLTDDEQRELVVRAVKVVGNRAMVIAGTGANATAHTIERTLSAEKAGAHAAMVVVPYYNKPTQEGLYAHYVAVARSTSLPLVIYNIPGRTGVDLTVDTLARIAEAADNVVAVKEATGNVLRAQDIARRLGNRLGILSGDDALTLPMMAVGARGVISVTSNVLPAAVGLVCRRAAEGRWEEARRVHFALLPLHEAMFVESNPSPLKAALAQKGLMGLDVRAPLVEASERATALVRDALAKTESSLAALGVDPFQVARTP
jgi:4-hydroxy-tetrahydrodipicolinate synthase